MATMQLSQSQHITHLLRQFLDRCRSCIWCGVLYSERHILRQNEMRLFGCRRRALLERVDYRTLSFGIVGSLGRQTPSSLADGSCRGRASRPPRSSVGMTTSQKFLPIDTENWNRGSADYAHIVSVGDGVKKVQLYSSEAIMPRQLSASFWMPSIFPIADSVDGEGVQARAIALNAMDFKMTSGSTSGIVSSVVFGKEEIGGTPTELCK